MQTTPRLGYRAELDGVRALAIGAVVAEHAFENSTWWVHGGHIGVELFFVLSGFLITTLLMEEHARAGRVRLRAFYGRRARRLGPALLVTVTASTALGFFWPWPHAWSVLHSAAAVLSYAGNYVAAANPDALGYLTHTWSLAVEEQFYLLFPVGLLIALRRHATPAKIAACCLALAVIGSDLRVLERLSLPDAVGYFHSETRMSGILCGAAVAAWRLAPSWPNASRLTRTGGWLALAGCAATYQLGDGGNIAGLLVSLPVVDVAGALIVVAVLTAPESALSRLLRLQPLVWLGRRSYALYLYQFPCRRLGEVLWPQAGIGVLTLASVVVPVCLAAASAPFERRWLRPSRDPVTVPGPRGPLSADPNSPVTTPVSLSTPPAA